MLSRDVLFYTLTVMVATFTFFTIWFFVSIRNIFRSFNGLIEDFRTRLNTIDEILHTIREKLTSTHLQLSLLVDGVKQLMSFINNRRDNSKKRRSSSRASSSTDDL